MAVERFKIEDKEIELLTPDGEFDTLFYANSTDFETYEEIWSRFEDPSFGLCVIRIDEWFRDLTPWFEPTVYEEGPDFEGKAPEHLRFLLENVIPVTEEKTGTPEFRGIVGFSLGGLFALYSFYETDAFFLCGCPSASLWYDGFIDWMKERTPVAPTGSIYFSVGDLEHKTEYKRMAAGEKCIKEACSILSGLEYDTCFKYTKGDHLDDITGKIERCLRWLTGE